MKRVLAFVLIVFSVANVARAILSLQEAQQSQVVTAVPPFYLVAMSSVWAIAFAVTAYGIVRDRRWAPRDTIATIVLYQANLWLNRLAFTRSSEATARIGFAALLSAVSIIVIGGAALIVERQLATRD